MSAGPSAVQLLRARAARAAWGLVALVVAWQLVFAVGYGASATPGDWQRARDFVAAKWEDGQLVIAHPSWVDPILRQYFVGVIDAAQATRVDEDRFSDIWLVSVGDEEPSAVKGLPVTVQREFGGLRVRRYAHQATPAVFSFTDRLSAARRTGRFFRPPKLAIEEVGFAPRRCIRAELRPGAQPALVYRSVDAGTSIVGYLGLADVFTLREIRGPIELSVTVDGTERVRVQATIEQPWVRFAFDVEPGVHDVGFHPRAYEPRRVLCLHAEGRR